MSDVVEAEDGEPLDPTIDVICAHIACVTEELGNLNAELTAHRALWSRLCALVMTDHRGDGLPTQEVTPDEMVAVVERLIARNASMGDAVAGERERCARVAETWESDIDWTQNAVAGMIAVDIRKGG